MALWGMGIFNPVAIRARFSQSRARSTSPSADCTILSAARQAAATAGDGAVEKMKLRARLIRKSISTRDPAMYPPETPSALPSVPIWISTLSLSPRSPANPCAPEPSAPTACASSRKRIAPWRSFSSTISRSGARSPSMLKTDSVTIITCDAGYFSRAHFRWDSSFSRSLCGKTRITAPLARAPSIRQAWASLSRRMTSPFPISAGIVPVAAAIPVEKTSAASVPFATASSSSRAACSAVVPQISRDAEEPTPQRAAASAIASARAGCEARPR